MRNRLRRLALMGALIGAGSMLFSGPGTSCSSFIAESALEATNFCFILDCQNGVLGGTIDPCSGIGSGDDTIEGEQTGQPLFTDCPIAGGP